MSVHWDLKSFDAFTPEVLYDVLRLRQDVFALEQTCLYPDLDGKDQKAMHLLGVQENALIAYARLFSPGDYYPKHASFGRVATAASARGKGFGKQLVQLCMEHCQALWPNTPIEISGQAHLERFYIGLGFQPEGDEYLEDDIPHRRFLWLPKI